MPSNTMVKEYYILASETIKFMNWIFTIMEYFLYEETPNMR